MIICRTPLRISFLGGGTDLPDWLKINKGQVISTTINKFGHIFFQEKDDLFNYKYKIRYYLNEEAKRLKNIKHPVVKSCLNYYNLKDKILHITFDGDLPARSGLGSSSNFTAGLINTINHFKNKNLTKKKLANETIFFEHKILKEHIGYQDQIAVSYGGLNHIEFKKKKFKVSNIKLTSKKQKELNQSILLCYTNRQRSASKIEKSKIKNIHKHKKIYEEIYKITTEALKLIKSKNKKGWIKDFGNLVNKYWYLKKKLDKKVSNQYIDKLCQSFLKSGAFGVKLLGAGSGGFILILAKPKVQKIIIKKNIKLRFVKTKIEDKGSQIIYS